MKKEKLKVAILYNVLERLQKGEERDILAEEGVIEEIRAVEEAIVSLNHKCYSLAIRDEIFTIVHWLNEIRPDVVFNLCESIFGNTSWEMNLPAMLDLFRIPYTGSPPLTLGLCQDKGKVKDILLSQGVLTPRYKIFERELDLLAWEDIYPTIVKPLHEDGSLGISKESVVYDDESLRNRVKYIFEKYNQPALVEEFIDGRELNVSLLEMNGKPEVLPISEIDYSDFPEEIPRICGYEAKWVSDSIEYKRSRPICPASLEWILQKKVEYIAIKVFKILGCRDYARVDIRVDKDGEIYVLEVNPNPDISPQSGFVRSLKAKGMSYNEFVGCLIEKALQRKV
jgi:D-alanine-D-alanine ligase